MSDRFHLTDMRFVIICLLLTVGSLWFTSHYFERVFPEASIDFRLTREQAEEEAERFMAGLSFDLSDYRTVTIFDYDDLTKVFLERQLGLEKANAIIGDEVALWKWRTRWFQPLVQEEFHVDITPAGRLMGFRHVIPEAAEGQDLESDEVLPIAMAFLANVRGVDVSNLEKPEVRTERLHNRIDHSFSWRRAEQVYAGAPYVYRVTIRGDRVAEYSEKLDVPEDWIREYTSLRSLNQTTGLVNLVLVILTFIGLLIVFVRKIMNQSIQWIVSSVFGFIAFVIFFLDTLNSLPLQLAGYVTTESFGAFISQRILQGLLESLSVGALIFLITAAAESYYRVDYPHETSIGSLFNWRSIRSKKYFLDSVLGYALSGLFIAYQVGFYLIADRFGAWSPAEIPYSNIVNTTFPWIAVILVGFLPAVSEEFFFRIFAISFFRRLFRYRHLAIVLAAVLWGFGHATYPNQPFFIRGLEVTLAGIVCGWILIRFGVLPLLIWHFTVDAWYTSIVLFRSTNLHFIIMGGIITGIMLIPLLLSLGVLLVKRSFLVRTGITNADAVSRSTPTVTSPVQAVHRQFSSVYRPFSTRRRIAMLTGTVVIALLVTFMAGPSEKLDIGEYRASPTQVLERADYYLTRHGGQVMQFRSVTYLADNFVGRIDDQATETLDLSRFSEELDMQALTYILQHDGVSGLNDVIRHIPLQAWAVRYYQPDSKEEWRIFMSPSDAAPIRFFHLLPSSLPGLSFEKEAANSHVENLMRKEGFDLSTYVLSEQDLRRRDARNDSLFTWERALPGQGNAVERLFVQLRGGAIGELATYIKIPEEWKRQRETRGLGQTVRGALQTLLSLFLSFVGLWMLFHAIMRREVQWGKVFRWSIVPTAFIIINIFNRYKISHADYSTAIALETFHIDLISSYVVILLLDYLFFALVFALVDVHFHLSDTLIRSLGERVRAWDSLVAIAVTGAAMVIYRQLSLMITAAYPNASLPEIMLPQSLDLPIPLVDSLEIVIIDGFFMLALVLIINELYRTRLHSPLKLLAFVMLAAVILVPLERSTTPELLAGLALNILAALMIVGVMVFVLRKNVAGYMLVFTVVPLIDHAMMFLDLDNAFFKANGVFLLLITATILYLPVKALLVKPQNLPH